MADTVFDDIVTGFKTVLQSAPAVATVIEADQVDQVPEDTTLAVEINALDAQPDQLGGLAGNPVEWTFRVRVTVYARKTGSSARGDAGTLLAAVYARLAANQSLGLGDGVFIAEPGISWDADRRAQHMAAADLIYPVRCRTGALSLE